MTHDHKDGCCGGNAGKKDGSCCGSRNIITILAVLVAIAALAYAFHIKTGSLPLSTDKQPKADTAGLVAGEDTVVARLNGKEIHKSDVAMAIRELGANIPPENLDQILPAFLDQYINLELINEAAAKEGIEKDPEVQTQIYNSRDQIVRAAYLRKLFEGKLGEDSLKEAYKVKYEAQPMPMEVHARHILVDDEAKAKDLIARINKGESFEKLASENSKDPSAQRGGDLGYFTQGEMVKEFGDAAFAMQPGQVTQAPVKTQFGWHVIKVEDKRQRAKPSFEEAKPALEQEARQAILDAKLQELRAAAKIENLTPQAQAPAAAPAVPGTPAPAAAPEAAPAPAPVPAQ